VTCWILNLKLNIQTVDVTGRSALRHSGVDMAAVSALARGPRAVFNELMKVIVRWAAIHKEGDLLAHAETSLCVTWRLRMDAFSDSASSSECHDN
jgi:hypothetical protein